MNAFFQLTKADFAGEFTGVMCALEPDHDREIINWEGTKKAVLDWSTDQANATNQKSWGNIRAQHNDNQVIGKLTAPPEIDERNKRIIVHGKVVDPVAKDMLQEGCYSGLSVGGAYQSRRPLPNGLTEYIPKLSELSLVDKPCSPSALLTVTRADGSVMQKHFRPSIPPVPLYYPGESWLQKTNREYAHRLAVSRGAFMKQSPTETRISPNARRANSPLTFEDLSADASGDLKGHASISSGAAGSFIGRHS